MTEQFISRQKPKERADAELDNLGLNKLPPAIQDASRVVLKLLFSSPGPEDMTWRERNLALMNFAGMHYRGELGRLIQEVAKPEEIALLASLQTGTINES